MRACVHCGKHVHHSHRQPSTSKRSKPTNGECTYRAQGPEGLISVLPAQSNVDHLGTCHGRVESFEPPGARHEAARGRQAQEEPLERPQLRAEHAVDVQVLPGERLRHDPRARGDHVPFATAAGEDTVRAAPEVLQVELGEGGLRGRLEIDHPEARCGDEDHHAKSDALEAGELQEPHEGGEEEQREGPDGTAGFQGHQHEVREEAAGDEKSSLELRGDAAVLFPTTRRRRNRRHDQPKRTKETVSAL